MDAPLYQWEITYTFDTAAECESTKAVFIAKAKHLLKAGNLSGPDKDIQVDFTHAQCIATDDPRLGER
jgi:hypothetical protein